MWPDFNDSLLAAKAQAHASGSSTWLLAVVMIVHLLDGMAILIRLRFMLTMATAGATFVALSKLSDCISETSAEHRQQNTPYAALHAAPDKDAAKVRLDAPAQSTPTEPDYLTLEAEKLESLKQALYAAFMAAPKAGIPTALVDLAATYTSDLRLQMTLRGFSTMPARAAKAPLFATPRTK